MLPKSQSWLRLRDVKLVCLLWVSAYALNYMFLVNTGLSISIKTNILVGVSLAAYIGVRVFYEWNYRPSSWQAGNGAMSLGSRNGKNHWRLSRVEMILAFGIMAAIVAVTAKIKSIDPNLDLYQIRQLHFDTVADQESNWSSMLLQGGLPFLYMGWVRIFAYASSRTFIAISILSTVWIIYSISKATGGRGEAFVVFLLVAFGLFIFRVQSLRLKHVIIGVSLGLFVLAAHVSYTIVRTFEGGNIAPTSKMFQATPELKIGNQSTDIDIYLISTVAVIQSYFGQSITILSNYLDSHEQPPTWGGYCLAALSSRIPGFLSGEDRGRMKDLVDSYSQNLGFDGNVWGTGLRELHVDFGYFGVPIIFALFALVMNNSLRRPNYFKINCICFVGIFMLASPFTNLFLIRSYQIWFIGLMVWGFYSLCFKRYVATVSPSALQKSGVMTKPRSLI